MFVCGGVDFLQFLPSPFTPIAVVCCSLHRIGTILIWLLVLDIYNLDDKNQDDAWRHEDEGIGLILGVMSIEE